MTVRVELYAVGNAPPEDLWAVVGDLRRLPEWTDADSVERIEPEPVEVGTEVVVVSGGAPQTWQVMTAEPRVLEVRTDTPRGPVAFGVRVARERSGSRVVLAGALHPAGFAGTLRARALHAPALRRRFDRWTRRALDLAAAVR